jgi:hypothetical protein
LHRNKGEGTPQYRGKTGGTKIAGRLIRNLASKFQILDSMF